MVVTEVEVARRGILDGGALDGAAKDGVHVDVVGTCVFILKDGFSRGYVDGIVVAEEPDTHGPVDVAAIWVSLPGTTISTSVLDVGTTGGVGGIIETISDVAGVGSGPSETVALVLGLDGEEGYLVSGAGTGQGGTVGGVPRVGGGTRRVREETGVAADVEEVGIVHRAGVVAGVLDDPAVSTSLETVKVERRVTRVVDARI